MPDQRSVLTGISGIDGSGKGYVTQQIQARLAQHSVAAASINVDGWLNLPNKRFNSLQPGKYFYENAIRFDDLFSQLVLPLRDQRSIMLIADFTEETATAYRKHTYNFMNVDVILSTLASIALGPVPRLYTDTSRSIYASQGFFYTQPTPHQGIQP